MKTNRPIERPDFVRELLADWKESWVDRRWWGLLPWKLAFCSAAGVGAACFMPADLWAIEDGRRPYSLVALFGALLTMNGLLLALGWNSFAKVYELCAASGFAEWLRQNDMVRTCVFLIDYIQIVLFSAIVITVSAFLLSLIGSLPIWLHRTSLGLTIGASIYALTYVIGAVRMVRDLIWYRAQGEAAKLIAPDADSKANVRHLPDRE